MEQGQIRGTHRCSNRKGSYLYQEARGRPNDGCVRRPCRTCLSHAHLSLLAQITFIPVGYRSLIESASSGRRGCLPSLRSRSRIYLLHAFSRDCFRRIRSDKGNRRPKISNIAREVIRILSMQESGDSFISKLYQKIFIDLLNFSTFIESGTFHRDSRK